MNNTLMTSDGVFFYALQTGQSAFSLNLQIQKCTNILCISPTKTPIALCANK